MKRITDFNTYYTTVIIALIVGMPLMGQPAGEQILDAIDRNLSSSSRVFDAQMIIHGTRGTRTIEFKSWSEGDTKAYTEYTNPAREKGTKMLKLDNMLWIYSPSTDRTIQITGHLLKQSVMGSDLSYEDMMNDTPLREQYKVTEVTSENYSDTDCWVLLLEANDPEAAYQLRKMWVDKNRNIPLKEELYAKSGKLLKRTELSQVKKVSGRWYPMKIVFKDMLKSGDGTEFIVDNIEFNIEIPSHLLSKASLR
jgi:outer membrane lipoprotein-sorting protein